ncbi:MAG: ComF family protein [Scytolyngbya sp. HA4215-MV1]|jgi:ComF family protein|nr:ComF family protein [Scytolyngbya sp. HA4215-MV1]
MLQLKQTFQGVLNLFLERACPLCQRSTAHYLCQDCQRQIQRCQVAGNEWSEQTPYPVFAWGTYGGVLKRTLSALKYENQPQLAQPLGQWLAESWLKSGKAVVGATSIVVPIPMHESKKQQRGYDQAELLAQSFCAASGLRLKSQGLERVHNTTAQFQLSPAAREQNLAGAFRLGQALQRSSVRSVFLLDDIYTTGATIRSATQTLQQQGIQVSGVLTIAIPKTVR